jgi:hypothetical protein
MVEVGSQDPEVQSVPGVRGFRLSLDPVHVLHHILLSLGTLAAGLALAHSVVGEGAIVVMTFVIAGQGHPTVVHNPVRQLTSLASNVFTDLHQDT